MKKTFIVTIENGEGIGEGHIADPLWTNLDEYDYKSFSVREVKGMTEEQYRKEIKRTMNDEIEFKHKVAMLSMGMMGEAGEICDTLKKHIYHGHALNYDELVKEFGDLEWYLQHLKMLLVIDNEDVRQKNIDKLRARYPEGFSEKASVERVDQ
ncbi:pyrophosphatase [Bacillus phage Anath]|uniref:Pyrophosphatase n=1 Tax=Bacillus phage Anath TaxID=2108114 RepID=A0A2P1JUM1_9CAUD|nr:pyrophosphatase [Bacillus phage Anath]